MKEGEGEKSVLICSIVVLYESSTDEIRNISDYGDSVDVSYVLDNSRENNEDLVFKTIRQHGGKTGSIVYKHFDDNIGLCRALNYGMEEAYKNGFDWALLMDSDSSFLTEIVDEYLMFLKDNDAENIAVLSPVHMYDRSRKKGYIGTREVKWAMTSGCFYNVGIFKKLGGFKEELFVDGLDIDYCYKALRGGV